MLGQLGPEKAQVSAVYRLPHIQCLSSSSLLISQRWHLPASCNMGLAAARSTEGRKNTNMTAAFVALSNTLIPCFPYRMPACAPKLQLGPLQSASTLLPNFRSQQPAVFSKLRGIFSHARVVLRLFACRRQALLMLPNLPADRLFEVRQILYPVLSEIMAVSTLLLC